MQSIDLNCDMGESYGRFKIDADTEVMKYIHSCNIACGFHWGDPLTIKNTITLAIKNGVNIGAHPSFPDLMGFGRHFMELPQEEMYALILYQIAALKGMTKSQGGKLVHVKPHGALYNAAAKNHDFAATIVKAVQSLDPKLVLFGPPQSCLSTEAEAKGLAFRNEVFADRLYNDDLSLASRSEEGSVFDDVEAICEQASSMVVEGKVRTKSGLQKNIKADTICIHGDRANAAAVARALNEILSKMPD